MSAENDVGNQGSREAIELHRRHIDRIDRTIVALLAERIRIGLALGEIKRTVDLPTRSAAREAEVLARVREAAARPLSVPAVERIFADIIEETTACQEQGHE